MIAAFVLLAALALYGVRFSSFHDDYLSRSASAPVKGIFVLIVFSIYILQRVPMLVLKDVIQNRYLFFAVCFVLTIALATGFDYLFGKGRALIRKGDQ